MSEANKSLMLSEAEIIEEINSDSLISVSLGAGQPQKNVKMSTLATVAAELFVFVKFSKSAPSKNANDILTPTICLNMNTLSNVPTEYGTLIVFGDYNHAVQLYTAAATTNAIYIRQRTSTVWSTWTNLL